MAIILARVSWFGKWESQGTFDRMGGIRGGNLRGKGVIPEKQCL
jgi:hypothetical protein